MAVITLPPQSYVAWKVSILILHLVAAISTIYRLVHRFRIRRPWWDDYLVFFPLAVDIMYCILTWIRFPHRYSYPLDLSKPMIVLNSIWLSLFPYLLVIWTTRMALALSLARIFPERHPARIWSFCLVVIMLLTCLSCMLVSTYTCTYTSPIKSLLDATHCETGAGGFALQAILLVAHNITSDLLLIISPLIFFWRVGLPAMERRLVLFVFCGSILTLLTAASLAILFLNKGIATGVDSLLILVGMCNIESAISLTVCNLTVISTCLYRALRRSYDWGTLELESTEVTTRHRSRPCTCIIHSTRSTVTEPMTLTEISSYTSSIRSGYEEWSDPTSATRQDSALFKSEKSETRKE
ncbi:hypothetical protein CPB84DRAFT_1729440 [Gymnopilus junonius]|uniref:Rhodopsin domain-containing protein n=1 Tax=Gymnopilus junonius TaxID=109634 RepID=A0A9P5NPA3_GYMJU|nr:hypothetical protein CPB84DRAFT_1729440 [Gymnopilus junonius]